jgi:diguanylate cyclase (GGDEF)-like protein
MAIARFAAGEGLRCCRLTKPVCSVSGGMSATFSSTHEPCTAAAAVIPTGHKGGGEEWPHAKGQVSQLQLPEALKVSQQQAGFLFHAPGAFQVERQRARAQSLEADTRLDPLTGLGNRRAVEHHLPALLRDSAAASRPMTLAMLDLDHFRRINDRHGHLVGDRVLVAMAQLISECARQADLVARFGGEEFMAVLPDADEPIAREICERIRQPVAGHDWAAAAPGLTVTLSVGLASAPPCDETLLATRADQALYRAKALGRNRVEVG